MTKSGTTDVSSPILPIVDQRGVGRVLSRIGDKWTVIIVTLLVERPHRFGELRRGIAGVSQQVLTTSLRALERDGFVCRTVIPASPPQVEYRLTALGRSLSVPVLALGRWACSHIEEVDVAQRRHDAKAIS